MGNNNSSRWSAHHRRRNVHEAVALEARRVAEAANLTTTPGTWHFEYAVSLSWGSLQDRITLVAIPQPFGGIQAYLQCAGCGARRRALYATPGAHVMRCRDCAGLSYRSQRLTLCERLADRALSLARQLGSCTFDDLMAIGPPEKPKGMHWRTYERRAGAVRTMLRKREDAYEKRFIAFLDRSDSGWRESRG